MAEHPRRTPTGAAALRPAKTAAIAEAALAELAEQGYGRLSMEAVAKRAGVGKSALYRRWPSKRDMVLAVTAELSLDMAADPVDTGSLRGDLLVVLRAVADWLTHPHVSRILPDLVAEAARDQSLARSLAETIGGPRRDRGRAFLERAVRRGELPPDTDVEIALDLVGALVYWRVCVRFVAPDEDYLESVADTVLRALAARDASREA